MSGKAHWSCVVAVWATTVSLGITNAAEKRRHDPHVHGVAEFNIAVEGSRADVEFRAPAANVMGFEYEAKSESDKKHQDMALRTVQSKMNQMLIFDPKLGCKFSEINTALIEHNREVSKVEHGQSAQHRNNQKKTGDHREVQASFSVSCDKPLSGSRAAFGVYKVFPDIHELKVQVLGGAEQSGTTIKKDKGAARF